MSHHFSVFFFFVLYFLVKDRNAPIMQQLSNAGINNTSMGRAGGNMNPMAVLQLFQSLQGLSTLAQLTSNLGALSGNAGGLTPGGGMGNIAGGGATGMPDTSATNPLAALGMLGSTLGLGGGGGGGGSGIGGLSSSHHSDGGTSGRQVFVRNVSTCSTPIFVWAKLIVL